MSSMTSNPLPASGPVAPTDTVGCDVTASGGIGRVLVVFAYPTIAQVEVAFDGDAFAPYFSAGSTRVEITDGIRLAFRRAGGWLGAAITLQAYPADADGKIGTAQEFSWGVTLPAEPGAVVNTVPVRRQMDPLGFGVACPFRFTSERDFATAAGKDLVASDLGELLGIVPGEIRWRPSLGTNVSRLRQRPNTAALAELARIEVEKAIARWEPRISVAEVTASRSSKNQISIKVAYKLGGERRTATMTI